MGTQVFIEKEVYLPKRKELDARVEMLCWMRSMEWDLAVIDEVFYNDNPTPQYVRWLVYRHGPEKAYRLLQRVLS